MIMLSTMDNAMPHDSTCLIDRLKWDQLCNVNILCSIEFVFDYNIHSE